MNDVNSTTVSIEHVRVSVPVPFEKFIANIDSLAGVFDAAVLKTSSPETLKPSIAKMEGEQGLMVFGKLDHGVLFSMQGISKKALRYYIGNPLIAFSMTQHDIGAALYAPLSVLFVEIDNSTTEVQFDKPSTLFGQFQDSKVSAVGLELDEKLNRLIEKASK